MNAKKGRSLQRCFFGLLMLVAMPLCTAQADDITKESLAAFFGVSPDAINIECPGQTMTLKDQTLEVCLKPEDKQRRCEVAVNVLGMSPDKFNKIAYDIRTGANFTSLDQWFSMMQIHSFPDKGEAWRCPVSALEMFKGKIRMYNRWDATPVSVTSGNNCTEPGSSIKGRQLFDNVTLTPQEWHRVEIDAALSATAPGEFIVSLDGKQLADAKGPNTYNDQRGPFLKFGIYKPTSWEPGNNGLCVSYRNVKIQSAKERD